MKVFLEEVIPQGFHALPDEVRQAASGDEVMQIELEGPDGGTWHFRIEGGQMSVTAAAHEKPTVTLASTVAGFQEFVAGRLRPAELGESTDGMAKMMGQMFSPAKRQTLRSLKGTFKARYCEGAAPDESKVAVEMFITFGGEPVNKQTPRMTILMPIDTFLGIQSKKLQAPQVFMAGGMRLTGDMSMAMQMQALLA
jgi:putative sterol carrier protein